MAANKYQLNDFLKSLLRLCFGLEKWFGIGLFVLFTDAFLSLYVANGYGFLERLRFYIWKLNLLIVICLLLLRWEKTFFIVKKAKFLLIFVGYVWLSHLWSPVPADTKYHAQRLIETTLFGIYFASRFDFREQTRMLGIAFGIGAVFSFIYVVIFPGMAIMNDLEAGLISTWRGVYIHKNTLGRLMVIGSMLFVTNGLTAPPKQRLMWFGIFGLTIILILGSQSKAALVSVALLLGISPLHRIFRWNLKIAIPLYIIVLMLSSVVGILLANYWSAAMGAIDKDPGLNGRVDIWNLALPYIPQRPWLGWGFKGFWRMWQSEEHAKILRTIATWEPPDGHQGFMDLVIELGIIGAFLFFLGFFDAFRKAIKFIRSFSSAEGVWPLGFMTYYIIMNLTQTQLMPTYTIYWLVYSIIISLPVMESENKPKLQSVEFNVKKPRKNLTKRYGKKWSGRRGKSKNTRF